MKLDLDPGKATLTCTVRKSLSGKMVKETQLVTPQTFVANMVPNWVPTQALAGTSRRALTILKSKVKENPFAIVRCGTNVRVRIRQ